MGTTTTSKFAEKVNVFNITNEKVEQKSNILPMSNYFGKVPVEGKDPFDRRVVKQLSDISFEEDSENDFEDVRSIKRQNRTVLTEENLKKYLSSETYKLNLEHHYWLKD